MVLGLSGMNPDAAFDSLFVAGRLQQENLRFVPAAVHLFAYLGCLLWIYRNGNTADWGYSFVGTELGAPYSVEIATALEEMLRRGVVIGGRKGLVVPDTAASRLQPFENMSLNQDRLECLRAACACTTALSPGIINSALTEEPELRRARITPVNRPLLEDLALSRLFEHFEALRKGLKGRDSDLRVPAVVWLSALHSLSGKIQG